MRSLLVLATLLATVVGSLGRPAPAAGAESHTKVAIIVGPVGEELTPVYISLAEAAAKAAEERGAEVARAYSPNADEKSVRKAVRDANIVIYFGHGVGTPNPYSDTPNPATTNGWGLNGPNRRGDHSDSFADGTLTYYGESWITQHAKPAPGWVMIYSNACYAPGAGEGQYEPATKKVAAERVSAYSRAPLADLGASAYFATDFFEGAAHLVGALLDGPDRPYRDIFMSEPQFDRDALVMEPHATVAGAETWLHKSPYFEGKVDYWYAFAGDPDASLGGKHVERSAGGPGAERGARCRRRRCAIRQPRDRRSPRSTGRSPAWPPRTRRAAAGRARPRSRCRWSSVAASRTASRSYVLVCADRCMSLPVVDSCPCYVGTADERVANLSHEAWRQISDMPLEEGLIEVEITLSPVAIPHGGPPSR